VGDTVNLGPVINTAGDELGAFLTRDAKSLFYSRDGVCGQTDLWVGERHNKHNNTGWHIASNLGCGINSPANDSDPFYVDNPTGNGGRIYFVSSRDSDLADSLIFDIFMSSRNKKQDPFSQPAKVAELSSSANDARIVLRRDGLEAFIASNRDGGFGNMDIWVSTRASIDDPWGTPVNLGGVVNSALNDWPGSISDEGTTLYIDSNRPGRIGLRDVWVITRVRTN
jgi:hypothetical protein